MNKRTIERVSNKTRFCFRRVTAGLKTLQRNYSSHPREKLASSRSKLMAPSRLRSKPLPPKAEVASSNLVGRADALDCWRVTVRFMPHRFVPWRRAVLWNQSRVEDARNAAPDYESGGQEFESLRARQQNQRLISWQVSQKTPQETTKRPRGIALANITR